MRNAVVAVLAPLMLLVSGCSTIVGFKCNPDAAQNQCIHADGRYAACIGAAGRCAVTAPDCASGWRFDTNAGSLANTCVPSDMVPGSGGMTRAPNRHQGEACGPDDICDTGNCVDGFCCDQPCSGQCQACDVAGMAGTCTTVTSGQPHGTRPACNSSATCGGWCDGTSAMACSYPSSSVICGASCDGHCDGNGGCTSVAGGSCPGGFACAATGCKSSCTANNDCQPNFHCAAPNCVRDPESDCFDGRDNNGDGLADCDDPSCTAVAACEPFPAGGAIGYLTSGSCTSGYSVEHISKDLPDVQTCSGCSCTFAANCLLHVWADNGAQDCSSPIKNWQYLGDLSYKKYPDRDNTDSSICIAVFAEPQSIVTQRIQNKNGVDIAPDCNASGGVPDQAVFQTKRNLCKPPKTSQAGCNADQVCAPKPPAQTSVCVRFAGTAATCPAGMAGSTWYDDGNNISDGRSCSCSCSASGFDCVEGTDVFYASGSDYGCGNIGVGVEGDYFQNDFVTSQDECSNSWSSPYGGNPPNLVTALSVNHLARSGGSCTTSGTVSGHVTPNAAAAVTLCCTP